MKRNIYKTFKSISFHLVPNIRIQLREGKLTKIGYNEHSSQNSYFYKNFAEIY